MNTAVKVILWFFLGAILVLIITHAKGFSTAVTATGGQVTNMGALLTGNAGQVGGVKGGGSL